jgi:hypothetical protein
MHPIPQIGHARHQTLHPSGEQHTAPTLNIVPSPPPSGEFACCRVLGQGRWRAFAAEASSRST